MGKTKKKIRFDKIMPYLYVAPMLILLFMFSGWSTLQSVVTSFFRDDGMNVHEFVGLKNYINILFHDRIFWISMWNLLIFFIGMNICVVFPVIAAKLTYSLTSKKAQFFVRSAFTIATVVPTVITVMLWKFIYYPNVGLVARVCEYFGMQSPNLLGNPATAAIAIIIIGFPWIQGLAYLMYFATFQAIDQSIIESAQIDGATGWQRFIKIELPEIKPIFLSLYITAFIGQFQDYERFLMLTGGGPSYSTMVPALYMYQKAFGTAGEAQYGYASALAVILFIITFTLSKFLMNKSKGEQ